MPSARLTKFVSEITDSPPALPPGRHVPSAFQTRIFRWFSGEREKQHLIIRARAGCSKTYSLLRGIDYAPEDSILLCAFNKSIADELSEKLNNPKAKAQTLHSLGFQAIRHNATDGAYSRVCAKRFDREDWLAEQVSGGLPFGGKRLVAKLSTKARELNPIGATVESLSELAVTFDLMPPNDSDLSIGQVARAVLQALELAKQPPHLTGIDYADMVFLPLVMGWLVPQFDMIVCDEGQDLSRTQLLVARTVLKSYGSMVLAGDEKQAIYGWRGSDSTSLDRTKAELDAEELPLNLTYRCPKRVVALAQKYVPDFQVADTAPDGIVDSVATVDELVKQAQHGDAILSRKNAPLARIAMALLRTDKRVKVQGRDIGAGLKSLIKRLANGRAENSVPAFLERLSAWEDREIKRLVAMRHEELVPNTEDKANTIRALALEAVSVHALMDRIDYLFSDNGQGSILCSSVHRAKGLEFGRVFVVRSTFFMRVACVCGHRHKKPVCRCGCADYTPEPAAAQEEVNLAYVCYTRAMRHLTFLEEIL